jgi:hypothetical protein
VPSRAAHESRLTARGFSIEGEAAVRRQGRGWRALFATERRRLPPQGDTDVFLALATEALRFLSVTPLRLDVLGADRRPPAPPPAAPPPLRGEWWTTAAGREEWMRRFIEAQERRHGRG